MPLIVTCEDCSTKYRLNDSAAGKSLTCKQCGKVLSVPHVAVVEPPAELPSALLPPENEGLDIETLLSPSAATPNQNLRPEAALEWISENPNVASQSTTTQATPSAASDNSLSGCVVRLFVLAGALWLIGQIALAPFWESLRTVSWPHVEGVITASDVQTVQSSRGARSVVVVSYRYEVNSISYTGNRICVVGHPNKYSESLQQTAARYPVKATVKVFYDPNQHRAAVLVPGVSSELMFGVSLAVIFLGLCVLKFFVPSPANPSGKPFTRS